MNRGIGKTEVLMISAVLLLLGGIFLPYLLQQREASRRNMCEYRLTQLGYAMQLAATDGGRIPYYRAAWQKFPAGEETPIDPDRIVGWQFRTLPFLRLTPAEKSSSAASQPEPRVGPLNQHFLDFLTDSSPAAVEQLRSLYFPDFVCPSDNPPAIDQGILPGGWNSYVANGGLPDALPVSGSLIATDSIANGLFVDDPHLSGDGTGQSNINFDDVSEGDGLDKTLMLSENLDSGNWTASSEAALLFHWSVDVPLPPGVKTIRVLGLNVERGQGIAGDIRFARISSNHPGGANVIFVSGRTEFLSENVDKQVFRYMMTSRDEKVTWPGTELPIFPSAESLPVKD